MTECETAVLFRRGQYVVARRGWARTFVGDDPEPVHQQVPRCRVLDVIERADGVHYRVRGWWVVPFRFVVSGDQLVLHPDQREARRAHGRARSTRRSRATAW
ncbi:hypothetical protein EHYA_08712 [Embleya hyalina]|uniref:Uncharacterized protein n=1 Tax=Embleya hyalina TaxID=516124 RepID=A0A401Z2F9_9ACTN|nr:hypothetical protein EHYA_08712 [Embleya hyalina]